MIKVPITLEFTKDDFQLLFELAHERGFIFRQAYGRMPKDKNELDEGAVKDSINNLVRDYLDMKKGYANAYSNLNCYKSCIAIPGQPD